MASLYDIALQSIDEQATTLSTFQGKVLLVVNVASRCGFTPQYTGLEQLYLRFRDRGFVVLGFPANDFGEQEPGANSEIAQFCSTEYPVSFPLFAKSVVTGSGKSPLYALLTAAQPTRITHSDELHTHLAEFAGEHGLPAPNALPEVLWNFEKFLVDRQGTVIARFNPDISPEDPALVQAIESALA